MFISYRRSIIRNLAQGKVSILAYPVAELGLSLKKPDPVKPAYNHRLPELVEELSVDCPLWLFR